MNEFLKVEYENCLDLLKYYDEKNISLLKFTTGVSSSTVSLVFGFHVFGVEGRSYFWNFASALSGVAWLGLLIMFIAMVQNRLYFVYPVRQVNAIRRAMLARTETDFSDNQMYLTTNVRPFKLLSLHTLMILLVAIQVGAFAGFCWFSLVIDATNVVSSIWKAVAIASMVSLALFILSGIYLTMMGQYHPDKSVHRIRENAP